jgi:hypothetical protein
VIICETPSGARTVEVGELDDAALQRWAQLGLPEAVAELARREQATR